MKLTKEQGIILTGFTGILMCTFLDFHEDVEKRLDRSVFLHEFGNDSFAAMVKELYREDFLTMMPEGVN